MHCVYEFELYMGENEWVAEAYDLPFCITQGVDVGDACESAADILRAVVQDALIHGRELPASVFGHEPLHGGINTIVSIDTSLEAVEKVSASEAARILDVVPSRITAMVSSGLLEGWRDGRNTWVTLDSIEARKTDGHKAGRPRTQVVGV